MSFYFNLNVLFIIILTAQEAFGAELPVDSSTPAKRPKLQSNSGLAGERCYCLVFTLFELILSKK